MLYKKSHREEIRNHAIQYCQSHREEASENAHHYQLNRDQILLIDRDYSATSLEDIKKGPTNVLY